MASAHALMNKTGGLNKGYEIPPHAKLSALTGKFWLQLDEVQRLGFHAAGLLTNLPNTLSALLVKVGNLQDDLNELDVLRTAVSNIFNDLKSYKIELRRQERAQELLAREKNSLMEKMANLDQSFTDDIDEAAALSLIQNESGRDSPAEKE